MTWTTAALAAVAVLLLPVTVVLVWRAIADVPRGGTFWRVFIVVIVAHGCLLWVAIARLRREARAHGTPSEPSLLSITDGVLKIERAGPDRGMDYSWEVPEIADIRISAAAPDRIFLSPKSLLLHQLFAEEVIRVSVERQSGEIDDVLVSVSGRYWADGLENKLRTYLGLAIVGDRVSSSRGGA
jgi:hypothetical protein